MTNLLKKVSIICVCASNVAPKIYGINNGKIIVSGMKIIFIRSNYFLLFKRVKNTLPQNLIFERIFEKKYCIYMQIYARFDCDNSNLYFENFPNDTPDLSLQTNLLVSMVFRQLYILARLF